VSVHGGRSLCAILGDRTLWCRGENEYGQLGDGTKVRRLEPVRVRGIANVVHMDIAEHACAVLSDHRVFCWGDNRVGQLGDGTTVDRLTPVEVPWLRATRVAIAGYRTCALGLDREVYCWGVIAHDSTWCNYPDSFAIPLRIDGLGDAVAMGNGGAVCILRSDHRVFCLGDGDLVGDGCKNDTVCTLSEVLRLEWWRS
jgi:hypothetical protein